MSCDGLTAYKGSYPFVLRLSKDLPDLTDSNSDRHTPQPLMDANFSANMLDEDGP